MAVAEAHPSAEELAAFTLGTLDDETQTPIEAHVAACLSCQERAAGAPGDTLVALLRRAQARPAAPADTVTEAPESHTPVPRLREAVAVADPCGAPVGTGPANDLDAIPPELARHERYRVVRLLGEGGMGSVYEAEQIAMQRRVALKVIRRADTAGPAALERFRREVRAAARLAHPNIVTAHDAETAGELHFLVMEYVEGITLAWLVKERGPLPIDEACEYVRQAALGLQHAHERGLVHRDIKPDNLIRCSDGTVKVLDFGLAALTAEGGAGLTEENVVMGTPEYMAPEQAEDSHGTDIRADLYSLGCTLYFLLTGEPPYPAPTPLLRVLAHRDRPVPSLRRARRDVPPELAAVVERLLAKKPEDRYQTPRELADALKPFTRSAARPRRKRGSLLVAAAVAGLLAGIVLAGAAVYSIQTDKGELVIQTDNEDVEVVVSKNGEVVKIIDTKTGKHVTLKSGNYELAPKGGQDGLKLSPGKVTLKRGETVLATITRDAKPEKVWKYRRLQGHTNQPWAAAFTADGKYVVSGGLDKVLRLWDTATGREQGGFKELPDTILAVAVSPNGRYALSGGGGLAWPNPHEAPGKDFTVRLWDLTSRQEIRRFAGHTHVVWCLAFSPDSRFALSGGLDHSMRLWNVANGSEVRKFQHEARVMGVCFSPDGRRGLSSTGDGDVVLWDLETGQDIRHFKGHSGYVESVAFSPDGRHILTAGDDGTLRSWDVERKNEVRFLANNREEWLKHVAFSPDGRRALTGGRNRTIRLWDAETGRELDRYVSPGGGNVQCVAFSPDGRTALSVCHKDLAVSLWQLPDPPPARKGP